MSIIPNTRRVTVMANLRKAEHMFRSSGRWRRLAALGAAGFCASTSAVVIGTSGVAMADVCGVAANGTTSWSTNAPPPGGTPHWSPLRSVWTKSAPGCHDYNIVHVNSTGDYAGFLQNGNGTWFECAAGYISIPGNVTGDWVECTSVATGTHMSTDTLEFSGGVGYRVNI
jgi:hypothetical protein